MINEGDVKPVDTRHREKKKDQRNLFPAVEVEVDYRRKNVTEIKYTINSFLVKLQPVSDTLANENILNKCFAF